MAKILKLDDENAPPAPAPKTVEFEWEGQVWHLLTNFNLIAYGEFQGAPEDQQMAAFTAFYKTLVVPEERQAWIRFLVDHNFPAETLTEKMQQLLELVGKDDSPSSAASSPTPTRRTSQRRSTVVSS